MCSTLIQGGLVSLCVLVSGCTQHRAEVSEVPTGCVSQAEHAQLQDRFDQLLAEHRKKAGASAELAKVIVERDEALAKLSKLQEMAAQLEGAPELLRNASNTRAELERVKRELAEAQNQLAATRQVNNGSPDDLVFTDENLAPSAKTSVSARRHLHVDNRIDYDGDVLDIESIDVVWIGDNEVSCRVIVLNPSKKYPAAATITVQFVDGDGFALDDGSLFVDRLEAGSRKTITDTLYVDSEQVSHVDHGHIKVRSYNPDE